MDRHFDEELRELKDKLIKMSAAAEEMIVNSMNALKDRKEDLVQVVFEKEKSVNSMQIEIDDMALKLIALRQPAASDLRFVVSAIKKNADLERIGELAINIVQRAQDLLKEPPLKPLIDLPRMAAISQGMVKDAIDSFINKNSDLARDVCKRDDQVDDLNDQIIRELISYMLQDPKNISRALDLIMVAKNLERIADHATNIGEDVFYIVKGRDIRHHVADGQ